jgi:hypothetical protein
MVVIPQRRGRLAVWIVIERRMSRRKPLLWQAIALRSTARAVKVGDGPDGRRRRHGAVDVRIDREDMLSGQLVLPQNIDWFPPLGLKSRTRILAFVRPDFGGGKLRMHPVTGLQHANAILRYVLVCPVRRQAIGQRQRIYVPLQGRRGAIGRMRRAAVLCFISLSSDAIRKNQSRYRCGT